MNNNNLKTTNKSGNAQAALSLSGNPTLLRDRLDLRQSTPDSEALLSSDDEFDTQRLPSITQKQIRRTSWLNDSSQARFQQRTSSFAGSSMSPTTSTPPTPSVESSVWGHSGAPPPPGTSANRGLGATSAFPWGSGVWTDTRKEPPSRLTEVLPSGRTLMSPSSMTSTNSASLRRDSFQDSTLPYTVLQQLPINPTPKTYRSQSYSVCQVDSEKPSVIGSTLASAQGLPRNRVSVHPSPMQQRLSRQNKLGDIAGDSMPLSNLKEVDDDDDVTGVHTAKRGNIGFSSENWNLRHKEFAGEHVALQSDISRQFRSRTSSEHQPDAPAYRTAGIIASALQSNTTDYAIEDPDEQNEFHDLDKRITARRMSDYHASGLNPPYNADPRKLESVKKAYWQSSLGFERLPDIPQSRRHSFADVPTRQGSVTSLTDANPQSLHNYDDREQSRAYIGNLNMPVRDQNHSYLDSGAIGVRGHSIHDSQSYNTNAFNAYGPNLQYAGNRALSPHRNMYGLPLARQHQLLYIVTFKSSRADVFYVQEGTGLAIKPGDLVIVEADRGTDLGTVATDCIDWSQARDLKDHYAEEHYKWLMMYSQGAVGSADGSGAGLMATANQSSSSAIGGMGPTSQHGMQEPVAGELKPKVIKRLAQPHEVQNLRDKEGSEAKAKRVCIQKVKEHGLHMEILDAEFQMDLKKLTFYYFADAYINFNSLVTDLFKTYKTRIWMSAVNPASFATSSLGLTGPSGIGPGAVGSQKFPRPSNRVQHDIAQNAAIQGGRGYGGNVPMGYVSSPAFQPSTTGRFQGTEFASYGYPQFMSSPRTTLPLGYSSMMMPMSGQDTYSPYASQVDREIASHGFASTHSDMRGANSYMFSQNMPSNNAMWISSMQDMSLNDR